MDDIHHTIDAFADGESVDPGRLKDALATAEGRDYLVDVLVLRGFVAGDGEPPRAAVVVSPSEPNPSWRQWWPAAAAIALVSVSAGYYAGQQFAPRTAELASPANVRLTAPEPTRVFKLEESADWTERVGVN